MLCILRLTLAVFFTTLISAEVKVASNGKGIRDPALDGKVSNEHLLFQADVSTKLACASTCLKYDSCVAFSVSPRGPLSKKMTCRGHDSKCISQSHTVDVPGSKTYFMDWKPPVEASSWLERPCSTDSDCPDTVSNVVCFPIALRCLCQPGYYYSHSGDNCVPDCPVDDLQCTFLMYPNRYILNNNIDAVYCNTAEEGQTACLANPLCRTIDKNSFYIQCYVQRVTALNVPTAFMPSVYSNHYQRTCA